MDERFAGYTGNPADLIDAADLVAHLLRRPAWHAEAACRGQGTRGWFPSRGYLPTGRALCEECPVRQDCLDDALGDPTRQGIWGGLSEGQRQELRQGRGA